MKKLLKAMTMLTHLIDQDKQKTETQEKKDSLEKIDKIIDNMK